MGSFTTITNINYLLSIFPLSTIRLLSTGIGLGTETGILCSLCRLSILSPTKFIIGVGALLSLRGNNELSISVTSMVPRDRKSQESFNDSARDDNTAFTLTQLNQFYLNQFKFQPIK